METDWTVESLQVFERRVADAFEAGLIGAPGHLSGGNEEHLLTLFQRIAPEDWVFSTYRSHYHALLKGIPEEWLMGAIHAGRSISIMDPEHRFFSSAIVGGIAPIAVGVAQALKLSGAKEKVWCFLGDMAATTGIFHEAYKYASGHDLPITFIVEDNGLCISSPTKELWAVPDARPSIILLWTGLLHYTYKLTWPHQGTGKWVSFLP